MNGASHSRARADPYCFSARTQSGRLPGEVVGLEEEIARREALHEQSDPDAATRAANEHAHLEARCRDFVALASKHRVRPEAYYYRTLGDPITLLITATRDTLRRIELVEFTGEIDPRSHIAYLAPESRACRQDYPSHFSEEQLAEAFLHQKKFNGTY